MNKSEPDTFDADALIDRVAREMLDVDPGADLRGRVLARIGEPGSRRGWIWMAVPAAAAALILLAVLIPRLTGHEPAPIATDVLLPVERPHEMVRPPEPPRRATESAALATAVRRVRATVVDEPLSTDERTLPPLAAPAALAMPAIADGTSTPVGVMEVAPISVRPLEVDALDDTPRERY